MKTRKTGTMAGRLTGRQAKGKTVVSAHKASAGVGGYAS